MSMKIKIIVKTNANENKIVGFDPNFDAYRIKVKAKPKEGEANREIEKVLSKAFNKKAKIISGFRSSRKLVDLL